MSIRTHLHMLVDDLRDTVLPTRKARRDLRAAWAKPGDKTEPLANRYFELTREHSASPCVDDRTWEDLEFPRIFSTMDTTLTSIGSQVLFKQLRTYADDAQLAESCAMSERLGADASARERIQLKLVPFRSGANAHVADFIFGAPPQRMKRPYLLLFWGLASVAALTGMIAWSWPVWIWLAILAGNMFILRAMSWDLHRDAETLKVCVTMLRVADTLGDADAEGCPPLQRMAAQAPQRARARRALGWMSKLQRPVVEDISVWLTFFFLAELIAYVYTIKRFRRARPILASTFELIGAMDAAIAVASYRASHPQHCQPAISRHRMIEVINGYHPLIADPVTNSVSLDQRCALITGSNMAGKTTFIKMLAINHVLGRTLGFCLADQATLPECAVMTSIRGDHSVESGKSHYFVEIEAVHEFIDAAQRDKPPIFVIDELFRGTNTTERVALARAVLQHLGEHALVLVTTHDVELQELLGERYRLFHFQENPDVEGFFDYRLKPGASTERNAIRLLDRMEFPPHIVADAMRYAAQS